MTGGDALPSPGALEEARHLAGPSAAIRAVTRLIGGQHADTWRVETENPATTVVVREFPVDDPAAASEQLALRALDGLGGLAPLLLAGDLDGRWSKCPTSLISWLDGEADIAPADPRAWARELGRALAVVHATPPRRLAGLPTVLDSGGGSQEILAGPLATEVRARWRRVAAAPEVLTHSDYWSGNVIWKDGRISGIVDWSGGSRGPAGFDLGWCRLDLVLLFDQQIADEFLAAYRAATGEAVAEALLWDCWAAARSDRAVGSWTPNYAPLGREDLDERELRRRHAQWTAELIARLGRSDRTGPLRRLQ
ncbi:MAG: phosphotransferase family protein [Solirubrobacterales bacterium]